MPEQDVDVEQALREMLDLLDAQRIELGKMVEECSNNPYLYDQLASLKSACAKLDRAGTELQWVLDAGLTMGFEDDPRQLRRAKIAQHNLLGVSMKTLTAVIEELNGEGETQEELAN
jgi:hypothetical protein